MDDSEVLAQEFARFDTHIGEYGWSVVHVGGDEEGDDPPFAYSVGLTLHELPEVLLVGLDPESAHWMVNDAAELLLDRGGVRVGDELTIDAGHAKLRVAPCPDPERLLLAAAAYFRSRGNRSIEAVQLLWEVDGAFPGDAGYPYGDGAQTPPPRPKDAASGDVGTP